MSKKIFIDNVGRTIIGDFSTETDTTLTVKNPAVINVVPNGQGQLQVQVIPLFFVEFLDQSAKEEGTTWVYVKSAITVAVDIKINDQLREQHTKIFNPSSLILPPKSEASVVKLFP